MEKPKEEPKKAEVKLTAQELQLTSNLLGQSAVKVVDAPIVINLINKLSRMIDETTKRT